MSFDSTSGTVTAAQIAAGNTNPINSHPTQGFSARKLTVRNTTNVTLTIIIFFVDAVNAAVDALTFTLTSNGVAMVARGVGFASVFGGTYTRTGGNEAAFDGPAALYTIQVQQNAAANAGNCVVEVVQQ